MEADSWGSVELLVRGISYQSWLLSPEYPSIQERAAARRALTARLLKTGEFTSCLAISKYMSSQQTSSSPYFLRTDSHKQSFLNFLQIFWIGPWSDVTQWDLSSACLCYTCLCAWSSVMRVFLDGVILRAAFCDEAQQPKRLLEVKIYRAEWRALQSPYAQLRWPASARSYFPWPSFPAILTLLM